jgi:hypothetical protein
MSKARLCTVAVHLAAGVADFPLRSLRLHARVVDGGSATEDSTSASLKQA